MKLLQQLSIALVIILICIPKIHLANNDTYINFYNKYNHSTDFLSFSLPVGFFQLIIEDDDELKSALEKMNTINFLIYDGDTKNAEYFNSELNNSLSKDIYHDLIIINDGGEKVTFKVREKNNKIQEFLMVVTDKESFVVLSINGEMDLDQVKKINSKNIEKMLNDK